jgi:hypothetical protein
MRKQITQGHVQHPFLQPAAQWRLERDRHRSRRGSKQRNAFLRIARASNDELSAQIEMLSAIIGCDQTQLLTRNHILGRKISALITALRHCG